MRTAGGRVCAVVVTTPLPELEVGHRYRVLGNELGSSGFRFTGEPTGRPPLPDETRDALRPVAKPQQKTSSIAWTDEDRALALVLQAEGLSQAAIAERVCGDRKFRSTVQTWLRRDTTSTPQRPPGAPNGTLAAMRASEPQPQ